jgi:peptidyl-prolyl cis-trans isomerase C
MKYKIILVAILVTASLCSNSTIAATSAQTNPVASKSATNLFPDKVVAKGKGFEVKQSEVDEAFIGYKSSAAAQNQTIPEDQRNAIEQKILDNLVLRKILISRATQADKDIAKTNVEERIDELTKSVGSPEALNRELLARGMTLTQFKDRLLEQQTCEQVVERELRSKINISDSLIKQYYEDNKQQFEMPERVKASHILISTRDPLTNQELPADKKKEKLALAEKVLAQAKKGSNFADLVKQYSDDPGSKNKGGEYTFSHGQMVPEFEKAAFALDKEKISDIVTTQFGYHIIKLLDKYPAETLPFEKVKNDIKNYLSYQEAQKQLPDYFEKIKKEANVEYFTNSTASSSAK